MRPATPILPFLHALLLPIHANPPRSLPTRRRACRHVRQQAGCTEGGGESYTMRLHSSRAVASSIRQEIQRPAECHYRPGGCGSIQRRQWRGKRAWAAWRRRRRQHQLREAHNLLHHARVRARPRPRARRTRPQSQAQVRFSLKAFSCVPPVPPALALPVRLFDDSLAGTRGTGQSDMLKWRGIL